MKVISAFALIAIASLTACQDTQPSRTETVKPTAAVERRVVRFDCLPETRADFVNNQLVREMPFESDSPTPIKVTSIGSQMTLTVSDTHLNAVREYTNSKPFGNGYLKYTISLNHDGKNFDQEFLLPADATEKTQFRYQRVTETVSVQDGVTNLAVILSGICTRS